MGQGCLAKASLNLSLVPQIWTELGAIRIHMSVHIPWVCKQHLLLSSRKIQSKVAQLSLPKFLCYPTGTQAVGAGGTLREDAHAWQFAEKFLVLSSAEEPIGRE